MLRPRWLVFFLWFVLLVLLAWVFMQDQSRRQEQLSSKPTLAPSMPQQFQDPGRLPLVIPQFCHHYYWETADLSGDSEVDAQDAWLLIIQHQKHGRCLNVAVGPDGEPVFLPLSDEGNKQE